MIRQSHKQIINKAVGGFYKSTGVDPEELRSEAYVAYYTALRTFKRGRGAYMSTWIWKHIRQRLSTFVEAERRYRKTHPELNGYDRTVGSTASFEFLDALTPDAAVIVNLVKRQPYRYLTGNVAVSKHLIIADLLIQEEWTVDRSWRAIKKVCRTLSKNVVPTV